MFRWWSVVGVACAAGFACAGPVPPADVVADGGDVVAREGGDATDFDGQGDAMDVAAESAVDALDATDAYDATMEAAVCSPPCGACQTCRAGICTTVGMSGDAMRIGTGWNHSLAVVLSGNLSTWGSNGLGELGLGDRDNRTVASPVMARASPWRVVTGGSRHSCGILRDGTLWCWGVNVHGQLGLGDTMERLTPTRVGTDSDWSEIQCGGLHSCGIRVDGSLWCWGANAAGQLGLGMTTTDQPTPRRVGSFTDWRRLAAKARFNCALRMDESLWCWGDNSDGQLGTGDAMDRNAPAQLPGSHRWTFVRNGPLHTCAITTTGELHCWGNNDTGQLGTGTMMGSRTPVRVGTDSDWTVVAGGFNHTCGVRSGGAMFCWGLNTVGQLGLGTTELHSTPTPVNAGTAYAEVLTGMQHTCAQTLTGGVQCWGDNTWGQVGDATNTQRRVPTSVCFAR